MTTMAENLELPRNKSHLYRMYGVSGTELEYPTVQPFSIHLFLSFRNRLLKIRIGNLLPSFIQGISKPGVTFHI
jgi:hypothetical protein